MIDTHVHLIDPKLQPFPAKTYGYQPMPGEETPLPALEAMMAAEGLEGVVLLQPSVYGYNNSAIRRALEKHPHRLRGVAMIEPTEAAVAALAHEPGMAGFRLNITDFRHGALDQAGLARILEMAAPHRLIVQILASPEQFSAFLPSLLATRARVIIDHLGSPTSQRLAQPMLALRENPNIYIKLSAPFRATPEAAPWPSLDALVDRIVENFDASNLLWGSDWPFINLKGHPKPAYGAIVGWLRRRLGESLWQEVDRNGRDLFGFGSREAA